MKWQGNDNEDMIITTSYHYDDDDNDNDDDDGDESNTPFIFCIVLWFDEIKGV